jgi:peptidoglycan/xylan/chitin deacetylase (PgdA/CDA1 family)
MMIKKQTIKKILINTPLFISLSLRMTKNINPRIFVYHRFCNTDDKDIHKVDVKSFNNHIKYFVKYFRVVTLGEYLELRQTRKKIPNNLLIMTIDDGYEDFYKHAFPILKRYGISATFFVTVNFIHGKIWLWPDRISYALKQNMGKHLSFEFDNTIFDINLSEKKSQFSTWQTLSDYCIASENHTKWNLIHALEQALGINVPDTIPDDYKPCSWDQLNEMSEYGIEIGSHTMNHPILSKIKGQELIDEIDQSKIEIEKQLNKQVRSFCYPNSAPADINDDVVRQVKLSGYNGAVFGTLPSIFDQYHLPRMGSERDSVNIRWKLSGMEYIKKIS